MTTSKPQTRVSDPEMDMQINLYVSLTTPLGVDCTNTIIASSQLFWSISNLENRSYRQLLTMESVSIRPGMEGWWWIRRRYAGHWIWYGYRSQSLAGLIPSCPQEIAFDIRLVYQQNYSPNTLSPRQPDDLNFAFASWNYRLKNIEENNGCFWLTIPSITLFDIKSMLFIC